MNTEPPDGDLAVRLEELAATVDAHDETLMRLVRDIARDAHARTPEVAATREQRLGYLDELDALYDSLTHAEQRTFESISKLTHDKRALVADLLFRPRAQREAVAFILTLAEAERRELAAEIRAAQ